MRVPFLILTPSCVAVGIGTAYRQTCQINWIYTFFVLIGAVSAHISVNAFNEYFDFKSGLDTRTRRTPFSGGSGMLPSNPEMHKATLFLALSTFAITAVIGGYFVWLRGWQLLPIGILGLILLATYTTWWVYHPILCLIAPGVGFGILMVMGTHFALTGTFSLTSFVASLVPTFLVSDLLLLNQFPDVVADSGVGRKNFPIIIGRRPSSLIYSAFNLLAYVAIVLGVKFGLLPSMALLGLITIALAIPAGVGAFVHADNAKALIPFLGMNVLINILTPVLVAVGLFIG